MIMNQIVSGEGGGGLDTYDATAYPEHILEGYTAYARGAKITGVYEPQMFVPDILYSSALPQISGLEIQVTCSAQVGKVLVVSCHLRGDLLHYTEGWTLVSESPAIINVYSQKIYVFAKIAENETEIFELERATSSNTANYFTWFCLNIEKMPQARLSLSVLGPDYNNISYTKPLDTMHIIFVSSIFWSNTTSVRWVSTPELPRNLQTALSPRLGVFFDDYTATERSFGTTLTGSTEAYRIAMCAIYFS